MVTVVRAEAVLTAQNKLRPGLAAAAAELGRFRAMQAKATTAFTSTAARAMTAMSQRSSAAMAAAQGRLLAAGRNQIVALGGPAALGASYKQFADVDRGITRIGITANASAEELAGVRKQIEGIAFETAQSSGKVTGGLDVLVAQGRSLKESLEFLPSVAKTAAAANAEVDDIAKTADAVASNFKIAGTQMQKAFDIMSEGGKAGMFELKDMSQFLPSLAPAASAAGFTGTKGLTDLVAMLQIVRKGTGTSGEANDSMSNIFQKMEIDETTKRFKKFGVDVPKEMAKARKEGRNLVEVFEELTGKALKGDLSKIPQLFADTQFARGMRALMTYRGEWQKLSKTIEKDAPGSVGRDLVRVTADARAQIDHMFSAVENRAVQLGGVLAKYIVLPLDKSLRDIEAGKNPTVNRVEEFSTHYNADVIAEEELRTGSRGDYDPNTRRLVDARKEFLTRQKIDSERERLGSEISVLEARKAKYAADAKAGTEGLPAHLADAANSRANDEIGGIDGEIGKRRNRLDEINKLVAIVSDLNQKLAETQGAMESATKPRMTLPVGQIKTDLEGLGQAGQTAGSQLADGFTQGMSRMENEARAVIARIQQQLNGLRAPSLSFGSVSGLPTGKQGPN
nr:phage tail tape measure protein [Methylobacterium sp. ZNC0032]